MANGKIKKALITFGAGLVGILFFILGRSSDGRRSGGDRPSLGRVREGLREEGNRTTNSKERINDSIKRIDSIRESGGETRERGKRARATLRKAIKRSKEE